MSRKKVKLQYIINQSNRRVTYNKRKTCLLKKVKEISILCGVDACIIIYGENSDQPEVWPPGSGTQHVLHKFCSLSEFERNKKAVDLEDYLKESIEKSQEKLRKQILENKKKRFTNIIDKALFNQHNNIDVVNMNELNDMKDELNDLMEFIDSNIEDVKKQLNSINVEAQENAGNGVEAMTGIEQQANVHSLDTNMGYQYLPWDNSMLPYHNYNNTNGL